MTMTGWTGADLSQNYTMLHDGFVFAVIDDNGMSIIITDLNGNETTVFIPSLHSGTANAWSFFLPKGYKVRYSRNYYADFMSIQYYLKRD